jgi:hypothetical protein
MIQLFVYKVNVFESNNLIFAIFNAYLGKYLWAFSK